MSGSANAGRVRLKPRGTGALRNAAKKLSLLRRTPFAIVANCAEIWAIKPDSLPSLFDGRYELFK